MIIYMVQLIGWFIAFWVCCIVEKPIHITILSGIMTVCFIVMVAYIKLHNKIDELKRDIKSVSNND